MKSGSRSQLQDQQGENRRLRSELSKTTAEYEQMKAKYEDLLKLAATQDSSCSSVASSSVSGVYCKNSQTIELQQWNQMWTRCVGMATQVVPFPSSPSASDQEKRSILIDIVSKLCDAVRHPEKLKEYKDLRKKYSKAKKNLHHLNQRCVQLMDMVHKNARTLEGYLQDTNTSEKDSIAQKLEELGEILAEQIKQEDELIRQSSSRKTRLNKTLKSMKKSYIGDSDSDSESDSESSDDFDIKKYKKHNSHKSVPKRVSKVPRHQMFGDSSSDDDEDSSSEDNNRLRNIRQKLSKLGIEDSSNDSEDDTPVISKKHYRKTKYSSSDDSTDESDSEDVVSKHMRSKTTKHAQYKSVLKDSRISQHKTFISSDSEESDDDVPPKRSALMKKRKVQQIRMDDDEEEEEDSDDFQAILKQPASRSRYIKDDAAYMKAELSSSSKGKKPSCAKCTKITNLRSKYGNHVNNLVGVANKIGKKYNHMKDSDESSSDDDISPPISRISYINDSVVKGRRKVVDYEESSD